MWMALLERNKLRFVDGSWEKEAFPVDLWNQWEKGECIVLSWLMNSVAGNLLGGVVYALKANDVWKDFKERFNKIDGSRTYNLY